MTLTLITTDGKRTVYNHVDYVSCYPHTDVNPQSEPMVRVEFKDSLYPSMTIALRRVVNLMLTERPIL